MPPVLLKRISIPGMLGLVVVCSSLTSCSAPAGGNVNPANPSSNQAYTLPADGYVTPRKIYPYDLKSAAKELAGKSMWVRPGAAQPYYRYSSGSVDTNAKAGVLPTLGRLDVKEIVAKDVFIPMSGVRIRRRQLLAVFSAPWQPGQYAVPIATENADSFTFTVNNLFFFEDPHQLYSHWPAQVWAAVDRHEAKEGMNELQVSFALGPEVTSSGDDFGWRWVRYRTDGGTTKVVFKDNQAVKITQEPK